MYGKGERSCLDPFLCMGGIEGMGRPLRCVWKGERAWLDPFRVYGMDRGHG